MFLISYNFPLLWLFQKILPSLRPCVTFHNKLDFTVRRLLAHRPTPKLEDHSLPAINVFSITLHIWEPSPLSAIRGVPTVVSGTHLSWLECYVGSAECSSTSKWEVWMVHVRKIFKPEYCVHFLFLRDAGQLSQQSDWPRVGQLGFTFLQVQGVFPTTRGPKTTHLGYKPSRLKLTTHLHRVLKLRMPGA
jgi:hypothetical protein